MLIGYIILKLPYTLRMIKGPPMRGWTAPLEGSGQESGFRRPGRLKGPVSDSVADDPVRISAELHPAAGRIQCFRVLIPSDVPAVGRCLKYRNQSDSSPEAQMLTFVYSVIIMIVSTATIVFVYGRKSAALKRKRIKEKELR